MTVDLHRRSSGKYLNTHRIGLGAAWPRPQMEASAITWPRSSSSSGVPPPRAHQLDRLLRAVAAGRALAAALVLEEAHEVERHRLHVVLVGQDHHRVAADEAAVLLELAEVERDVGHVGRQDAARGAAGKIALEVVAVGHAAAELDQLSAGRPGRRQHARPASSPGPTPSRSAGPWRRSCPVRRTTPRPSPGWPAPNAASRCC